MRAVRSCLLALALLAACGGDDGGDTASPPADDDAEAPGPDDTDAAPAPSGDSGCPVTAEQVAEVLGAAVEAQACTFFPPAEETAVVPNASVLRQVAFACDEDIRVDLGYTEPLDGFDVDAFVQRDTAFGAQIIVCVEPPLEVLVDLGGDADAAIAAARELAALALGGG